MSQLYRLHDWDEAMKRKGAVELREVDDPHRWNKLGWGIFQTVNSFNGPRRIENLTRINAWAIDMDAGTKAEMQERLRIAPVLPSKVVETKRGYQAYWKAKDAIAGHWNALVIDRLVPFFGADPNARDLARILRAPGYLHMKDPKDPFMVRVVYENDVAYSEMQLAERFPDVGGKKRAAEEQTRARRETKQTTGDDFWTAVSNLDCVEFLSRVSGHPAVGGEQYTFRRNSNGGHNIMVDGKGTSAWVDTRGRIGSLSRGGPTAAQWLRWFGLSYGEAAKVLKQLFPQLEKLK